MIDQVVGFDPLDHQDSVRALVLTLRSLRLGQRVQLADGTVVRSITIPHGSHLQRRFAVIPQGQGSGANHRAIVLGQSSYKSASEAAMKALGKKES